ncbi:MAG: hypothetical protein MI867_27060 [Pseudomonadales bacterium]|nr:hypothetical protein [Pseudomonadales bacterium]
MTNQVKKFHVYKDITQIAIDRTIETAESIHNTIQEFVLDVATTGIDNQETIESIKAVPRENVSKAYSFARDINRQVGHAISEALSAYEHKNNVKFLLEDESEPSPNTR